MVLAEQLIAAAAATLFAIAPRLRWQRWGLPHAVAAGFILYPSADALLSFVDLAPLIGEYTVLQAYTVEQLNRLPVNIARRNLLIPLAGLGLAGLLGGARVVRAHAATVAKGAGTWRRDLWLGLGLVPLFILAQQGALLLLQGPAGFLQTGDESALFSNATVWHVLALSLVPAVAEELYYRGLLQGLFEQALPGRPGTWAAMVLQGLIFAIAHAGFTTLSHLLGPLAFGLGMGYLRSTVGLGACMMAHASINLAFFAVDPGAGSLLLLGLTGVVVLAGLPALFREARTYWSLLRSGPERVVDPPQPTGP